MNEGKAKPTADPLIDEVRAVRQAISDEVGHDLARLAERLREVEKQYASRIVTGPKRGPGTRPRRG